MNKSQLSNAVMQEVAPPQQKDLSILQTIGYNGYKYQYQLFKDGKYVKNELSNTEYRYGLVCISPSDGSARLSMMETASQIDFANAVDEATFIIPVITSKN